MSEKYGNFNNVDGFFSDLKSEITRQARAINQVSEETDLDGFSVDFINDGWVKYRGMSWGFALQHNPEQLVMTWGPDGPFVGVRQVLLQKDGGDGHTCWLDKSQKKMFSSVSELVGYGLANLAAMVGDEIPVVAK